MSLLRVRFFTQCDDCEDDLPLLPEHKDGPDHYRCGLCKIVRQRQPEVQ